MAINLGGEEMVEQAPNHVMDGSEMGNRPDQLPLLERVPASWMMQHILVQPG